MERITHQNHPLQPFPDQPGGDGLHRSSGIAAFGLHDHFAGWHAGTDEIASACGGLAHPVTGDDAASDHDTFGPSLAVEGDGVIEAGGEDGRRAPIVLGRPEDDDGVGGIALVEAGHGNDRQE